MNEDAKFKFDDETVAESYDAVLVPSIFIPWGEELLDEHGPWDNRTVLDLACGTGAVASLLAGRVGPDGKVLAVDLNANMLGLARKRCKGAANVEIMQGAADKLPIDGGQVDCVVCQQGFQFFPDKTAAASEMLRVLRPFGKVVLTCWLPVEECGIFGAVCRALEAIGAGDISTTMRVPFDHMPEEAFRKPFESAGFQDVRVQRRERDLELKGGPDKAFSFVESLPIYGKIKALPDERRAAFVVELKKQVAALGTDGCKVGKLATTMLCARKLE